MRCAVITDVHANLPALLAALEAIRAEGCDLVVHTGDAIAIGPFPEECLALLLGLPNARFVRGNHEDYFVEGLPEPGPSSWQMSEGEAEHQRWTHARLDPELRPVVARWPHALELEFEGVRAAFVHYGLRPSGRGFAPIVRDPTAADLDRLFERHHAPLVFYGHLHGGSDLQGQARYVNPGSLGCHTAPVARYCVAEFHDGRYSVAHRGAPYDDAALLAAFEQRQVPERRFIYRAFFGGRFPDPATLRCRSVSCTRWTGIKDANAASDDLLSRLRQAISVHVAFPAQEETAVQRATLRAFVGPMAGDHAMRCSLGRICCMRRSPLDQLWSQSLWDLSRGTVS